MAVLSGAPDFEKGCKDLRQSWRLQETEPCSWLQTVVDPTLLFRLLGPKRTEFGQLFVGAQSLCVL